MTSAAVALGGNLGRPEEAFASALDALAADPDVTVRAVSSLWRSAAWGPVPQPDYLNAAALLDTARPARDLLRELQRLEAAAGRQRAERWGPRTLDLDLIFYGDETCAEDDLQIPHPRMEERSFVLEPLVEIAPDWRHPCSGLTAREARDRLRASPGWTPCERVAGSRPAGTAPEGRSPWAR